MAVGAAAQARSRRGIRVAMMQDVILAQRVSDARRRSGRDGWLVLASRSRWKGRRAAGSGYKQHGEYPRQAQTGASGNQNEIRCETRGHRLKRPEEGKLLPQVDAMLAVVVRGSEG